MSLSIRLIAAGIIGGIFGYVLATNGITCKKPDYYVLVGLMILYAIIQVI
jgi:hypothetical protein